MDENISQQDSKYFCECQNVYIPANLLSDHLSLPFNHKICKFQSKIRSSDEFNLSILRKIHSIIKVQAELQSSSINLTRAIIQNTALAITKLEQLIRIYKNILSNPPHNFEVQDTEYASAFGVENSLNEAMINHFNQNIVAQRSTVDGRIKMIKSKILKLFYKKSSSFFCMAMFSNEEIIVTGGLDGFIRVWNTKHGNQCHVLKKHKSPVYALAIDSGDSIMLSGSHDCSVILWDLKSTKHLKIFKGHESAVGSVLISKSSKVGFSGSLDGTVKIWDLENKEIKSTLPFNGNLKQIRLLDGDKMLAVCGKKGLEFWTIRNKEKREIANINITAFVFSNDESHFIIGTESGSIQIWTLEGYSLIDEKKQHNQQINKIAFTCDSQLFATCSNDKKVVIWNLKSRAVEHSHSYELNVTSVLFFKDSQKLAVCTLSPSLYFYNLKSKLNEKMIDMKIFHQNLISISEDFKFMAYGH